MVAHVVIEDPRYVVIVKAPETDATDENGDRERRKPVWRALLAVRAAPARPERALTSEADIQKKYDGDCALTSHK